MVSTIRSEGVSSLECQSVVNLGRRFWLLAVEMLQSKKYSTVQEAGVTVVENEKITADSDTGT